jgi:hypothetical protein
MLTTLAQYFESIHNARVGDGSLQRKHKDQICQSDCREYRHELQSCYHDKLKHIADKRVCGNGQGNRNNNLTHDYKSRDRHSFYRNQRKTDNKNRGGDRKTPPEGSTKKPCHVHGPDSMHSYAECHANPRNQHIASNNNNYSIRTHDSHYQDDCHRCSDDESHEDRVMSVASNEGEVSTNASAADRSHDNYHLDNFHILKKNWRSGNMPPKSPGNNAIVSTESGFEKESVQMPSQLPRSLSLNMTMTDVFAYDGDDVSMDDSFIKIIQGEEQTKEFGLDALDGQTDAFFN